MARDYKTRRPKSRGFSGWIGLGAGLAVGLAAAGYVYVRDHRPDTEAPHAVKALKKRPRGDVIEPDAADGDGADVPKKSYDFYNCLLYTSPSPRD